MTKEQIDQLIDITPEADPVEYAIRFLLVSSQMYGNAACDPDNDDSHFRCNSSQAVLAATAARLLVALKAKEDLTELAFEVIEAAENGMGVATWVARMLNNLRIVVPA